MCLNAVANPENFQPEEIRRNALDELLLESEMVISSMLSRHPINAEIEKTVWEFLPFPIAEEMVPHLATLTPISEKRRKSPFELDSSKRRKRHINIE
jgi:hypothetical protein